MREGESRLYSTVVLNPGYSLESLGDLSANVNPPTIKPMKSTFWGSDPNISIILKLTRLCLRRYQVENPL